MTTALNGNTQYCHLVSRQDADSLVVPGTITVGTLTATAVAGPVVGNVTGNTTGTHTGDVVVSTVLKATAADHKLGFYTKAATPIVQQTGVAVDAAGIHAALVALGLITA